MTRAAVNDYGCVFGGDQLLVSLLQFGYRLELFTATQVHLEAAVHRSWDMSCSRLVGLDALVEVARPYVKDNRFFVAKPASHVIGIHGKTIVSVMNRVLARQ